MIVTLTPNPALDVDGVVEKLRPNEKTYVHDERRFPGGNALNAARFIHRLGQPVLATGFLGGGTGEEIRLLLKKEGVRHDFVEISGTTRINITVSERATDAQTRLSFEGPRIRPEEARRLQRQIESYQKMRTLVVGGSFPPGFGVTQVRKLLRWGQRHDLPVLIDVPAAPLKELLPSRPFFCKPNLTEFCELMGRNLKTRRAIVRAARPLLQKLQCLCISSVEDGALFLTRQATYFARGPRVKVRSTVGAGDSMVALFAEGIYRCCRPHFDAELFELVAPEIFQRALGAALATISSPGTAQGERREFERLWRKVEIYRELD